MHPTVNGKDELLDRLRRIEGQVRGIQHMVERRDPCTDVLTQISATRAALTAVGLGVLEVQLRRSLEVGDVDVECTTRVAIAAAYLLSGSAAGLSSDLSSRWASPARLEHVQGPVAKPRAAVSGDPIS